MVVTQVIVGPVQCVKEGGVAPSLVFAQVLSLQHEETEWPRSTQIQVEAFVANLAHNWAS